MGFRTTALLLAVGLAASSVTGAARADGRAMLILDSSNSMWGKFETDTKGVIANQVLVDALKKHGGKLKMGLMSYGHRSKVSCQDIETLLPIGPVDAQAYAKAIEALRPQGRTPISRALTAAMQELKAGTEPSAVVLIADGLDNCGPDPCAASAALKAASPGLRVHVVALDVAREDQPKLACLATNTGGSFAAAASRPELMAALDTAFELIGELPSANAIAGLEPPISAAAEEAAKILGIPPGTPSTPPGRWADFVPPLPRPNPRAADWPKTPDPVAPEEPPLEAPVAEAPAPSHAGLPPEVSPDPRRQEDARANGMERAEAAAAPEITGAIPEDRKEPETVVVPSRIDMGDRKPPALPDAVRPAYLVAEEIVERGRESILLRARITAATDPITRPVRWTVHKVEETPEDEWPLVGDRSVAEARFDLGPGEYVVRASYGAIRAAKVVLLQPRQRVDVTFILNAGGLRVRPALAFLDPPPGVGETHWVFETAAEGSGSRNLFAESSRIGEVIRLNAGTYHLVSRFGDANAVVETDVTVKPGTLTEVEINHKAGIVHLGFARHDAAGPTDTVTWQISDTRGTIVVRAEGSRTSQILAPGRYTAVVEYAGRRYDKSFEIGIGETKDVNITGR